ncbi:MAG: DNA polymerase III subunit delta, partial [Thermanaerothrix sp.]|nr:DNA polymerase III subunit delta [Thermanaerothrix sp.]
MTDNAEPQIHLIYGEDLPGMQAYLETLARRVLGEQGTGDFNFVRLDAQDENDDRLHAECMTLPFWGAQRLIVYSHPLQRLRSAQAQKRFLTLLNGLPSSTYLVIWIEDHWIPSGRDKGWSVMKSAGKWLLEWVHENSARAVEKSFPFPPSAQMPAWIIQHARALGGAFTPGAARVLANHVGNDTHGAHQEILKLLTYVDYRRPVSEDDVLLLTAPIGQANVFEMTNAAAQGNVKQALQQLEILLNEQDPIGLLALIVREFRLLLLTRELTEAGERDVQVISERLKVQDFIAQRLMEWVRLSL